jgi:hypothetical protein
VKDRVRLVRIVIYSSTTLTLALISIILLAITAPISTILATILAPIDTNICDLITAMIV